MATPKLVGVIPQTGEPVYRDADGSLTMEPMSDLELSAKISERLDWIEEEMTRMQIALVRRQRERNPRAKSALVSMQARRQIQEALRVLHEAARAVGETPGARAQAKAESELNRVWSRAKDKYQRWAGSQRKSPIQTITPWHALSEEEQAHWFGLADDRVPRTWRELAPEERGIYRDRFDLRPLPAAEAAAHHERNRWKSMRRRAYRQVEDAVPYRVLSPEQRMADVAAHAQNLSWVRAEHAAGRMSDLTLAIQQEHYRRALHAYTRPFEPYKETL